MVERWEIFFLYSTIHTDATRINVSLNSGTSPIECHQIQLFLKKIKLIITLFLATCVYTRFKLSDLSGTNIRDQIIFNHITYEYKMSKSHE